ncbi:hypothetical protein [Bradyrhizobium sp. SZCCHNPS1003]|uniref:hypothetical protein n=1 Tax=Bradyrhizobium sp. SZCCHNPS1003 TaxID=3057330 RepID=UPI0028EE0168|nr:hypothetical protein [Bradyrhizobium sp. SZCCHNPS1003]
MTVQYWIAKNVEDPFRNETRNVGVIARDACGIAARFIGERDTGELDRRLLGQRFRYPDVYLQWLNFWRSEIGLGRMDSILKAKTPNYFVVEAGEITDTGGDSVEAVCAFLYSLLISEAPVMEAFELGEEEDLTRGLDSEISHALTELNLLADAPKFGVRHPVMREHPVRGKHVVHKPSFSQKNGRLYVYEAIDFTMKRPKIVRERAGWMAYMYADIKQEDETAETFSIFRPNSDDGGETVEYAKKILGGESMLVNWADDNERKLFLSDRQRVATSL